MVLLIVDRLAKQLAILYQNQTGVGDWLFFGFFVNPGAVFSLPMANWLAAMAGWSIVVGLLFWLIRLWSKGFNLFILGLIFLLVGGMSNSYDRLIWGGVIDYVSLFNLMSFNLADCYLIIGLGCLLRGGKQLYVR